MAIEYDTASFCDFYPWAVICELLAAFLRRRGEHLLCSVRRPELIHKNVLKSTLNKKRNVFICGSAVKLSSRRVCILWIGIIRFRLLYASQGWIWAWNLLDRWRPFPAFWEVVKLEPAWIEPGTGSDWRTYWRVSRSEVRKHPYIVSTRTLARRPWAKILLAWCWTVSPLSWLWPERTV